MFLAVKPPHGARSQAAGNGSFETSRMRLLTIHNRWYSIGSLVAFMEFWHLLPTLILRLRQNDHAGGKDTKLVKA
jgi:hypothetical protein